MSTAIFPGSFDPITLGHMDIIRRASVIFDRVVICVMYNSAKRSPMFTPDERVELIKRVTAAYPNVLVDSSSELLAVYAEKYNDAVVLKGLRDAADFVYEFQLDKINKKLTPGLDTVFLPSSEGYAYLSSTVAREMAMYGADLKAFVPEEIIEDIENKSKLRRN